MTGLQTVPYRIAGMGLNIVLLEEKIVSNSPTDRQGMRIKDFTHRALACKFHPNYNKVGKAKYAK